MMAQAMTKAKGPATRTVNSSRERTVGSKIFQRKSDLEYSFPVREGVGGLERGRIVDARFLCLSKLAEAPQATTRASTSLSSRTWESKQRITRFHGTKDGKEDIGSLKNKMAKSVKDEPNCRELVHT